MALRDRLQTFIVGNAPFVGSHSDFKSTILCGQLAICLFLVGVLYIIIDLSNNFTGLVFYYGSSLVMAFIVLVLIRMRHYRLAKVLLILGGLCLTFIFTSNDTYRAGVYIYFIVTNITALALFGFKDSAFAFGFALLSIFFFYLSYVVEFKVVMLSEEDMLKIYQEDYVRLSFISNFIIGSIVCVLIVYFLLDVNYQSEKQILKQNNELAKTNQELDRFVYSASHDLRAPLSSLLGLIDISQRSQTAEEREAIYTMMKGRVSSMELFISEIIDYSRNARQDVKLEATHVLKLLKNVVENLKYIEGHGEVVVNFRVAEDLIINTDPGRLKVILNNIIGNAFKYRDRAKASQYIDLSATIEPGKISIEVKDNGIGIAPEHHAHIFEMFYRASENSQGSGLGLYIVKETMDRLNGTIQMQSVPNEGSTFTILLPA